ncbi:hypothetical protein PTKIN_Ptkin03bG0075400 [Pterospermum kingtungense]
MAAPEAPLYYVGIAHQSAAFRLMKQMGWEKGEGLGKDKQGIKAENNENQVETKTDVSNDTKDQVIKATRQQGRYKKRERGKLVHAYSSKDLEGIPAKKVEESSPTNPTVDCEMELIETTESVDFPTEGNKAESVSPEWWGHKYGFVSGGFLGETTKKKSIKTEESKNSSKRGRGI